VTPGAGLTRRQVLGAALAGGAAAGLAGCTAGAGDEGAAASPGAAGRPAELPGFHSGDAIGHQIGHQIGIAEHALGFGLLAAFTVVDRGVGALRATLQALTGEARRISDGLPVGSRDPKLPPVDTGVLADTGTRVRVTAAVGASLFDERFGLAPLRPAELVTMGRLANDRLDQQRCHGDLLLTIGSDSPDGCQHGLRQLMRATRSGLVLRWTVDGYSRPDSVPRPGQTTNRNLLGFKDGSANPDPTDDGRMRRLVWIGDDRNDGAEPAWTVGGTYQAVRVTRMLVERWDRAALAEQEAIIGRAKASGAPLGRAAETDEPDYASDPAGERIPLDAHIRLANPRTAADEDRVLLRKGFSYTRGFDGAGTLDQGLAFVSFQRRLDHVLVAIERLRGEPLEEYVRPEGGGFYFVPPAVPEGGFLGQQLLDA
jgi:deferrochelatase/peroxidase EfeB